MAAVEPLRPRLDQTPLRQIEALVLRKELPQVPLLLVVEVEAVAVRLTAPAFSTRRPVITSTT